MIILINRIVEIVAEHNANGNIHTQVVRFTEAQSVCSRRTSFRKVSMENSRFAILSNALSARTQIHVGTKRALFLYLRLRTAIYSSTSSPIGNSVGKTIDFKWFVPPSPAGCICSYVLFVRKRTRYFSLPTCWNTSMRRGFG